MFTGIIEEIGVVREISPSHLTISAEKVLKGTKPGDSIALNGACLTVVAISRNRFDADISAETLKRTTFAGIKNGDRVNLERALRLSDRIDGHLVSGHIDGIGSILDKKSIGESIAITVGVAESLSRYMISKGSVAVDGISLTINSCRKDSFEVNIIPHTAKLTALGFRKVGDPVNIEVKQVFYRGLCGEMSAKGYQRGVAKSR